MPQNAKAVAGAPRLVSGKAPFPTHASLQVGAGVDLRSGRQLSDDVGFGLLQAAQV